jgi:hypothetical protein
MGACKLMIQVEKFPRTVEWALFCLLKVVVPFFQGAAAGILMEWTQGKHCFLLTARVYVTSSDVTCGKSIM